MRKPDQIIDDILNEIIESGISLDLGKLLITKSLYIDLMTQHGVLQGLNKGMQGLIWKASVGEVQISIMPLGLDIHGPDAIIFMNGKESLLFGKAVDPKKAQAELKEAIDALSKILGI